MHPKHYETVLKSQVMHHGVHMGIVGLYFIEGSYYVVMQLDRNGYDPAEQYVGIAGTDRAAAIKGFRAYCAQCDIEIADAAS